MKFSVDVEYLHELLCRYQNLNENTKEKINIQNAIVELLQPCVTSIILTYKAPLDWDLLQDAMESLIIQVKKWDVSKTKKSRGKANDLGFFVCSTHNFAKNWLKKENKRGQREVLYDPLNSPYSDRISQELPREVKMPKVRCFKDERLQIAYEYCIDVFMGNAEYDYLGVVEWNKKIREEFGLTYQNTKDVLLMAENTIREYVEEMDCD